MEAKQYQIAEIVGAAERIVIIQADNPDADSLGSALALEHILSDLGKDVALYCGVNIPDYLRYLSGWDRVLNELPSKFDASIIVDASTHVLLEKLQQKDQLKWLKAKPCIVLDHHSNVDEKIDFAAAEIVDDQVASTGDLIFNLSVSLSWGISPTAAGMIMMSILGDTQGLTNELTRASTYRTMAALTDLGADRPLLEELRRDYGKMAPKIYQYKATLIEKTEFLYDGKIAVVTIAQAELNEFSPLYNPVALIQPEFMQVKGVAIGIVYKVYDDGRITAALRSAHDYPICGEIAVAMGGGGHPHASGFKIVDGRKFAEVQAECLKRANALIEQIDKEKPDETVQYTF